jgi:hypothetical protein
MQSSSPVARTVKQSIRVARGSVDATHEIRPANMQPANNTLPGSTRPHTVLKSLPPKALPPRPFRSQLAVIDKLHLARGLEL